MNLQELLSLANMSFSGSPKRYEAFGLVNGRRSGKEIALSMGRPQSAVLDDLRKLKEWDIIEKSLDKAGDVKKKDGSIIYEKNKLLKSLPKSYFDDPTKAKSPKIKTTKKKGRSSYSPMSIPPQKDMLAIFKNGEDQLYEFKEAGVEMRKLSKEIGAFANTKSGGLIFYGIQDDGTIAGSDKRRQAFDQSIQNSVRNNISPSINIKLVEKELLGNIILIIQIPPWNKKDVYQYNGTVYIRKGSNIFSTTPEELKKLHAGKFVI